MNSRLILLLCVCMASSFVLARGAKLKRRNLSPIIMIPGDGGSQLEAKLDKPATVHYICEKTTSDYFSIWLNLELLVPYVIDCFIDNIKLVYNNETRKTSDQPGVSIRVPGFGEPDRVEWVDPSKVSIGAYFKDIGNALVSIGYERNVNLHGAPFDFRKGPNELMGFLDDLKTLIEETYTNNGNEKVIVIAHSMGGPLSALFFQLQSQEWKDQYIRTLITLSGAFAGSAKALKVFVAGDDLGAYVLNQKVLKQTQITFPSLAWLLPNSDFWPEDENLVETPEKNYTSRNLKEFFQDIDYITGWEMRLDQLPLTSFNPPGVEIHCLHGYGVKTIEKLVYGSGKFPDNPDFVHGEGDGTVNQRSLESCNYWSGKQNQEIFHLPIKNVDHMQILSDKQILKYIMEHVQDG